VGKLVGRNGAAMPEQEPVTRVILAARREDDARYGLTPKALAYLDSPEDDSSGDSGEAA
jgi:hypothetical protein